MKSGTAQPLKYTVALAYITGLWARNPGREVQGRPWMLKLFHFGIQWNGKTCYIYVFFLVYCYFYKECLGCFAQQQLLIAICVSAV